MLNYPPPPVPGPAPPSPLVLSSPGDSRASSPPAPRARRRHSRDRSPSSTLPSSTLPSSTSVSVSVSASGVVHHEPPPLAQLAANFEGLSVAEVRALPPYYFIILFTLILYTRAFYSIGFGPLRGNVTDL